MGHFYKLKLSIFKTNLPSFLPPHLGQLSAMTLQQSVRREGVRRRTALNSDGIYAAGGVLPSSRPLANILCHLRPHLSQHKELSHLVD